MLCFINVNKYCAKSIWPFVYKFFAATCHRNFLIYLKHEHYRYLLIQQFGNKKIKVISINSQFILVKVKELHRIAFP